MCQKEVFKSKPPDVRLEIVELVLGVAAANIFSDFFVFHQDMFYILFLQSRRCSFQNQNSACSWIILHVKKVLLCIFLNILQPNHPPKKTNPTQGNQPQFKFLFHRNPPRCPMQLCTCLRPSKHRRQDIRFERLTLNHLLQYIGSPMPACASYLP